MSTSSPPTSTPTPTPSDLLQELREDGCTSGSYAEIEGALIDVMGKHAVVLPPRVTARDVLVYARNHGLIARKGDKLVLQAAAATSRATRS